MVSTGNYGLAQGHGSTGAGARGGRHCRWVHLSGLGSMFGGRGGLWICPGLKHWPLTKHSAWVVPGTWTDFQGGPFSVGGGAAADFDVCRPDASSAQPSSATNRR